MPAWPSSGRHIVPGAANSMPTNHPVFSCGRQRRRLSYRDTFDTLPILAKEVFSLRFAAVTFSLHFLLPSVCTLFLMPCPHLFFRHGTPRPAAVRLQKEKPRYCRHRRRGGSGRSRWCAGSHRPTPYTVSSIYKLSWHLG